MYLATGLVGGGVFPQHRGKEKPAPRPRISPDHYAGASPGPNKPEHYSVRLVSFLPGLLRGHILHFLAQSPISACPPPDFNTPMKKRTLNSTRGRSRYCYSDHSISRNPTKEKVLTRFENNFLLWWTRNTRFYWKLNSWQNMVELKPSKGNKRAKQSQRRSPGLVWDECKDNSIPARVSSDS